MSVITRQNQRGFTLIELLAVMATVAVLAGIVSVSVGGTGETSKDTQTKQAATTLETAAADYFSYQEGAEGSRPRRSMCWAHSVSCKAPAAGGLSNILPTHIPRRFLMRALETPR